LKQQLKIYVYVTLQDIEDKEMLGEKMQEGEIKVSVRSR